MIQEPLTAEGAELAEGDSILFPAMTSQISSTFPHPMIQEPLTAEGAELAEGGLILRILRILG
jgi:hypothetical protein